LDKAITAEFPQSVIQEFSTVDLLLNSSCPTGRTDSFVIAWVKAERQVRRIFTYLVYQFPVFSKRNVQELLDAIASQDDLYFDGFIRGFDALYPQRFRDVVGHDDFDNYQEPLARIKMLRNKILHGQPTGESLSARQLAKEVEIIRNWCSLVARKMFDEIGYDGFARNSYRKCKQRELSSVYRHKITDTQALREFMKKYMGRERRRTARRL
jgi:hypothetical protein